MWADTLLPWHSIIRLIKYVEDGGSNSYANYTGCGNTLNGNHPIAHDCGQLAILG